MDNLVLYVKFFNSTRFNENLPFGFSCGTKLKIYVDLNSLKILRNVRIAIKLEKMFLTYTHERLFCHKLVRNFEQLLENLKLNRKP